MKEEILSGLKNAIERGSSLESAMRSFINAGYSEVDVKDAAGLISAGDRGITEIIGNNVLKEREIIDKNNLPTFPIKNKDGKKWMVIILIIIGFIILGIGGYLFYYLNKI